MNINDKKLQAILDRIVDNNKVFGATFAIKKENSTWFGASGNLTLEQPYFIASTTKLFNFTSKIRKFILIRIFSC